MMISEKGENERLCSYLELIQSTYPKINELSLRLARELE